MYFLAFLNQTLGQVITPPGGAGGTCVDLVNAYLNGCYDMPHVYKDAVDWAGITLPGWAWVGNTPTNYPISGDIVVWGPYPAHAIGSSGHLAIAIDADPDELMSFDQNWPEGHAASYVTHDYGGVLGWWYTTRLQVP